jgi:preprotein translocase subunit SecA/nephrocystin-3
MGDANLLGPQIRVFISSTFCDMQADRDALVKNIFPQLRKLCESRAVTWTEVGLRWGITSEPPWRTP